MAKITLFDLLGVAEEADPLASAALKWPRSRIKSNIGFSVASDPSDILNYLNLALEFRALRPGATAGQVGLTAEVVISNPPSTRSLVLTQMPDIAFNLLNTAGTPGMSGYRPANLFVQEDAATGLELIIEGLPVEIQLPLGLIGPLRDAPDSGGGPDVLSTVDPFVAGDYDSLQVRLSDTGPTSIRVHVRVRMTEEMDFILEPSVPISIGPCRFSGLPCKGVHDFQLVPSPVLRGDEHSEKEQALEWARHRLDRMSADADYSGVMVVRTLDLDSTAAPLKELSKWMNAKRSNDAHVEFVLEDLAIPFFGYAALPLPSHGTFGLRRRIQAGDKAAEAFDFQAAPVKIEFGDWSLVIEQLLLRSPASLDPLDQFIFLQLAALFGSGSDPAHAATFSVTDEWTIQAGWRHPTGLQLFKIADATLKLWGVKVGWSLERFASEDPDYDTLEQLQLLFDLALTTKPTGQGVFKIRSLSGKDLEIVLRDVGWDLGEPSFGGIAFPEGAQFIFFDVARLIVEEMGWVTENSGARYFSFSGGVSIFSGEAKADRAPAQGAGSAAVNDEKGKGGGIRFLRLRFRTSGNPDGPPWLLDGVSANLTWGTFSITGFGMVSEFSQDGHEYKEFGFGLQVQFDALAKTFKIGVQFFHGRVQGPTANFKYWMFGFQFSPIPIGSFEIVNIRFLLTGNMVPNLPAPDGHDQNMRLFRWYRDTGNAAITLPTNRKASGWIRQDESFALGAGLGLGLAVGKVVYFDAFVFYHKSPTERGLMIALEVYVLKGEDPAGFGVLEFDLERDKWGLVIGVSFTLKNITGFSVPLLGDFVSLTGTMYAGNKPGTFAIGQLNDQSTWLAFRSEVSTFVDLGMVVGICLQVVDAAAGPRGFGFMFIAKGGATFGIGKFQIYGGFGFIAGVWGNESVESGFVAWIGLGIRIKVFWVFNFGASIRVEFDYLGGEPPYRRLGCEIRIDTPWFMPDVTFRFEKVWDQPDVSALRTMSTPLISAGALDTSARTQVDAAVTPVVGTSIDEKALFSLNQMRAFGSPTLPAGALDALVPASVDCVVAINFKPSVDDKLSVGEITPDGAGTHEVNDLESTVELVQASIRRRPRFGTGAGVWTELLAPEDTELTNPADFPPGFDIEAHFSSTVSFRWDRDLLKEDRLDPRRLLINAETPFTLVTSNPEGDESHAHFDDAWPCCDKKRLPFADWHQLDFMGMPLGVRAPRQQAFAESDSRLHWVLSLPPLVVSTAFAPSPWNVARVRPVPGRQGLVASIAFDEPVSVFQLFIEWRSASGGSLVIEGYDGLSLEERQAYPLGGANLSLPIELQHSHGFTSVRILLVDVKRGNPNDHDGVDFVEIARMRYRTVDELIDRFTREKKCKSSRESTLSGSGKLAWLPNHDYEIGLKARVVLDHSKSAAQQAEVAQKVYFRTKGLPGLNAAERIGDELEQYVESTYPGASPRRLYRSEALHLAFNERFNSLLPVNRAPSPDNPDERNQILEWVLVVERVGNATTRDRVTKTAADWIVAHRTTPPPPFVILHGVVDSGIVVPIVRKVRTRDPLTIRFELIIAGRPTCGATPPRLHNSQVLIHQPVDPTASPGDPALWQPRSTFRANVRRKDAPFVERASFHNHDFTAFDASAEGSGSSVNWTSAGGVMRRASSPIASTRQHAVFGESDTEHVQITTIVDPEGAAAGIGVAVAGSPLVRHALMALVDESSSTLRIVRSAGGAVSTLDSVPLPAGAAAPYPLRVMAFDDELRASVGEASVRASREELREGRLSLVAEGGGRFASLVVEGLDAYRLEFQSSRYADFEEHIASFDGEVAEIAADAMGAGAATGTASSLLAATATRIADVMAPNADPEERQRLFDRWVRELGIPLQVDVAKLELSRLNDSSGAAQLLLLESPEPLPFSLDVTVALKKRFLIPAGCLAILTSLLGWLFRSMVRDTARSVPRAMRDFADDLQFDDDRVTGVVARETLSAMVTPPRTLVRAVDVDGGRRLDTYDVELRPGRGNRLLLAGTRARSGISGRGERSVRAFETMRVGELGIADEVGRVVGPFVRPTEAVYRDVPLRILTNGDETRALLIPVTPAGVSSPLTGGRHRLEFALDRARFRSDSQDSTTNYRAQALLPFAW